MNPLLLGLIIWFAVAFGLGALWWAFVELKRRQTRRSRRGGDIFEARFGETTASGKRRRKVDGPQW